jgi:integrase
MANLVQNSSGLYSIRFRLGTQRFNRSLETTSEKEAREEKGKIEKTIRLIKEGEKDLPDSATPEQVWNFLRSGGKRSGKVKLAAAVSLETVVEEYFASLPEGAKEERSLKTERTHTKTLKRHLRASTPLYELSIQRMQGYVTKRQTDKGHMGKPVKADTIKKELQTFRQLWDFAAARSYVSGKCPIDDVVLPKRDEKPPFKTWEEIEATINRGGYTEEEQEELWHSLFLRDEEIEKLLDHVRAAAAHPFIYPMFAFPAYTGARRSEILRSEVGDLHLNEGYVLIREKKRRTDARTSYRDVALHPRLKEIMAEWLKQHPGGRYTISVPPGMIRSKQKAEVPRPLTESQAHDHFKRTLAESKWKAVRGFHVLRHSFASNLASKGVHQSIIDRWMGHQTEEMRQRYRHLLPEEKRQAMDAMSKAAYSAGSPSS